MSASEALARLIRARYDQSPPGKWPMEDSLAEFILEHAADHGLAVVQLPEPTESAGRWERFSDDVAYHLSIDAVCDGVVWLTPDQAKRRAAVLLAAANAADQSGQP